MADNPQVPERHLPANTAPENEGAGHETGDVNVFDIGMFAVALLVTIAISLAVLVGVFKLFQAREAATPTAVSVDPNKVFPEPRLERTPAPDLKAVRAEEDRVLNSYGWVDAKKGLVRIPIQIAIDVLAKKGLPYRPPGAPIQNRPVGQNGPAGQTRQGAGKP